jgi:Icc-related predicted phosphoesterase
MATKYGMISDLHEDPNIIVPALEMLKQRGAEKLLVNGDIGETMEGTSLEDAIKRAQNYSAFILNKIGESGLEAYVQPGSHETLLGFEPVMEWACEKYPQIYYIKKPEKREMSDHDLVFLPGSDVNIALGEYGITSDLGTFSGKYLNIGDGKKFEHWRTYVTLISQGFRRGARSLANMNDLRRLVTCPEKTVVVCHVPRKFDNKENSVDVARFGKAQIDFFYERELIKQGTIIPAVSFDSNFPLRVVEENRGNEDLRKLYEELGITKAVSGHFHESSHRAHDSEGNPVAQNTLTTNLFWNSGHLDRGYTGILTVDGENVSYENITLSLKE